MIRIRDVLEYARNPELPNRDPLGLITLAEDSHQAVDVLGISGYLYGHANDTARSHFLNEVADWIAWLTHDKDANVCLLDTTTIVRSLSLINAHSDLSVSDPQMLWDLSTFVDAVVLHDHVFHLPTRMFRSYQINDLLGDQLVFNEIPLQHGASTERDSYGETSPEAAVRYIWGESCRVYSTDFERVGSSPVLDTDTKQLMQDWSVILNREVTQYDLYDTKYSKHWGSYGPVLRSTLLEHDEGTFAATIGEPLGGIRLEMEENGVLGIVDAANRRMLFNAQLGTTLGIPYVANPTRWPMKRWLAARGECITEHLKSLRFIDDEIGKIMSAYMPAETIRLPVLIAVLLSRLTHRDEFWNELRELRGMATGYRELRREFDRSAMQGNVKDLRRLQQAIHDEARSMVSVFPLAAVTTASKIIPTVASAPSGGIAAFKIIQSGLSMNSDPLRRFVRRMTRPEHYAVQQIAESSLTLANALPHFFSLWDVPTRSRKHYVARFQQLGTIAS